MKKIVVLVWDFFGGGAERVAVTLANALKSEGLDVTIVAGRDRGPNRSLVRPDIPVLLPPHGSALGVLLHLRQVLTEIRPDVLLSHQTTRNVVAIAAHLSSAGRRKRLVVGVEHGEMGYTSTQTRGLGLKVYFKLARLLYPFASGIVAVSDNVGESIRRYIGSNRVSPRTLPNPVIFPSLAERAGEPVTHPFLKDRSAPVFVAVGRLEQQKNYALMLEAFRRLVDKTPARLVICGVGSLQEPLERQRTALCLEDLVDLAGYVDNPYPVMRAADTLVMSSVWEGLPTVAIEALACGTQVVSTDNSAGIHAILNGGCGWITPLGDTEALAEAMRESICNPKDPALLAARAADYEASTVARVYLGYMRELGEGVVK